MQFCCRYGLCLYSAKARTLSTVWPPVCATKPRLLHMGKDHRESNQTTFWIISLKKKIEDFIFMPYCTEADYYQLSVSPEKKYTGLLLICKAWREYPIRQIPLSWGWGWAHGATRAVIGRGGKVMRSANHFLIFMARFSTWSSALLPSEALWQCPSVPLRHSLLPSIVCGWR